MDPVEPDEAGLAFESGDAAAWDALLRRFGPRLLRYLTHLTRDPALAVELARESFLRVHAAPAEDAALALPAAARLHVAATRVWRERAHSAGEDAAQGDARAALWLVAVEGLGEREVGEALGVSAGAASGSVARARADTGAGAALAALPLPELPVALVRGVQLGLARAGKAHSARAGKAHSARADAGGLPSLRLPRSGRVLRRAGAVALAVACVLLAWLLVARIPRSQAPPAPPGEAAPPRAAERAPERTPAPEEAAAEPQREPAPLAEAQGDAPTVEDYAVIELLDVLEVLGDVGKGGR